MRSIIITVAIMSSLLLNAQRTEYIEPELKNYVYEVLTEFKLQGVYKGLGDVFIVKFSDVKGSKATAVARGKNIDGFVHIVIYKELWELLTYAQKRLVILHELGHDYLNLEHCEGEGVMMAELTRVIYPSDLRGFKEQFYIDAKGGNLWLYTAA